MTAGEINKQIVDGSATGGTHYPQGSTYAMRFYKAKDLAPANKANKDIFGNYSKKAVNWISGPTHEVCL